MTKRGRLLAGVTLEDMEALSNEQDVRITDAGEYKNIPKDSLYSAKQVRTEFNEEKLLELCISLEEQGQIQPIVVSKFDGKGYLIQKGERRWRAAMMSGKITHVQCIVKDKGDILEQIAENLLRDDLTPLELGRGFQEAKELHDLNNKELAEKLGKSPTFISKHLTAIEAPSYIIDAFEKGIIGDVETINTLRGGSVSFGEDAIRGALEAGEPVTRKDARELVNGLGNKARNEHLKKEKEEREKSKGSSQPKPQTKHQKVTSITVKVGERHGLVFASGKHADKLTVLFDDGELESIAPEDAVLVGYRV